MAKNKSMTLLWTVALYVALTISAAAVPPPPNVPDIGSTALLLTAACFGIAATRRFLNRGK